MRQILPIAFFIALLGCGLTGGAGGENAQPKALARAEGAARPSPLAVVAQSGGQVRRVTYLIPGALSTSAMFGDLRLPQGRGHRLVEYRFPGMQGQPLLPAIRIAQVAALIAADAAQYPKARIDILAFSTGAAIALEAAGKLPSQRPLRLVVLSGATPFPGAYASALRGGLALTHAALRAEGWTMRQVWGEYYKTLLYGYGWRNRADLRQRAEALAKRDRARLVLPQRGLGRAQTEDLLGWRLSQAAADSAAQILFLHGARDPVFPVWRERALAKAVGGVLCLVPDGGHLLLTTHPEIRQSIRAFLAGRWQAANCPWG